MTYFKWVNKSVEVVVKGTTKCCKRTIKEKQTLKRQQAVTHLNESIPKYMLHLRNISHQYSSIDTVKKNLAVDEILIHIDFSENYCCKYTEEVQSAHFGSSKPQVSLHTVVVYYRKTDNSNSNISYCTISNSLRHDPSAICVHLGYIFEDIKSLVPTIRHVNFLSDGPSTQYRNKKMFYLIATHINEQLGAETIRWHYSESGHGKGAPDGVGGCIKRMADYKVGHGEDIPDYQTLVNVIKANIKGIKIFSVDENKIPQIDALIPANLPTFKGTMQVHEVTWRLDFYKNILTFRQLSCLICNPGDLCSHYNLGSVEYSTKKRLRYGDIYSDSDSFSSDDDVPLSNLLRL